MKTSDSDLRLPQAQLIAQSIGQAFSVAYQEFLRANGINPEDLSQKEYSDLLNTQDMYNDDLIHFSKSENCKDVSAAAGGSVGARPMFAAPHCHTHTPVCFVPRYSWRRRRARFWAWSL